MAAELESSLSMNAELSEVGRARQAMMLDELRGEMRRFHRRRRVTRAAALASIFVFAGAISWRAIVRSEIDRVPKLAELDERSSETTLEDASDESVLMVERVTTDSTIRERLSAKSTGLIERVNDEELLQTLDAIGRPSGLVRIGDETRLTSQVVDRRANEGSFAPDASTVVETVIAHARSLAEFLALRA